MKTARLLVWALFAAGIWVGYGDLSQAALVGFWDFNGTVLDRSGQGNHGTLAGAVYDSDHPAATGVGSSLSFGGGSNRVEVASSPSLDSSTFTLSYWIKDLGQTGAYSRVTSRDNDRFETAVGTSRQLNYYPGAAGWTTVGNLQSFSTPSPADWIHVAFVQGAGTVRVYANGTLIHQQAQATPINPTGKLVIGSRWNSSEGFLGKIDDAALWNTALPASVIQQRAQGQTHPLGFTHTQVTSNPAQWTRSTVRKSGGGAGTWSLPSPLPADWLPDLSTYTETPSASAATGVVAAASDLGVVSLGADGGNGQPAGVQFYRTTFQLPLFTSITANLVLAADNGAQVFINGVEIGRETSYLVENWTRPYSSLTINNNGSITGVTLFDQVASSFTGWRPGLNEVVLAVRNPIPRGLAPEASPFGWTL